LKRPGEDARPTRRRLLSSGPHRHPSSARHVHGAQQGGEAKWPARVALRQRNAARSPCTARGKQDGCDSRRGWRKIRGGAPGHAWGGAPATASGSGGSGAACRSFVRRRGERRRLAGIRTIAGWSPADRRRCSTPGRSRSSVPRRRAAQSRTTGCASGGEDIA
jgi:hypothetical protein